MSKQPAAVRAQGRVCVKVAGSAAGKPISVHRSNLRTGDEACCRVCGKTGDDLQSCSKCRKMGLPRTYYCSPECQETDWTRHKKVHKEAKTAVWVPVTEGMRAKAEKELHRVDHPVPAGPVQRRATAISIGKVDVAALVD